MKDIVRLDSLFKVKYGNQFDLNKMVETSVEDPDGINFVSRSSKNLGVSAYVKPYQGTIPFNEGLISVSLGGTYLLSAFVQERPFYTAQNVAVLSPITHMDIKQKLFYCICLSKNRFRYSAFGREANRTLSAIAVPGEPPAYLDEIEIGALDRSGAAVLDVNYELDPNKWESFEIDELFKVTGTKTTPVSVLESYGPGDFPYVTTQATNNGVRGFYDFYTEEGNVLVVDSAAVGYCSYQETNFSASDHVEKLVPGFDLNRSVGLFLTTILNQNQFRYSYGRKASQKRLRRSKIRLPTTNGGNPDWEFMENYVKSLPYSYDLTE